MKQTREEFVADYAARSGIPVATLLKYRTPEPCTCRAAECTGWAMVTTYTYDDE